MDETQEKSVIESDSKEKIGTPSTSWTCSTDSSSTMVTTGGHPQCPG